MPPISTSVRVINFLIFSFMIIISLFSYYYDNVYDTLCAVRMDDVDNEIACEKFHLYNLLQRILRAVLFSAVISIFLVISAYQHHSSEDQETLPISISSSNNNNEQKV